MIGFLVLAHAVSKGKFCIFLEPICKISADLHIISRYLSSIISVIIGISNIRKDNLLPVILTTIVILLLYALEVYFVQSAFNLNLSIIQCIIILLISSISMMIPAMPGNFGTFESSVIYTLSLFNIVDNFGFSFILHIVSYIPYTFIGFMYFLEDFNYKNMRNIIN